MRILTVGAVAGHRMEGDGAFQRGVDELHRDLRLGRMTLVISN
jgi:hypothetical protein